MLEGYIGLARSPRGPFLMLQLDHKSMLLSLSPLRPIPWPGVSLASVDCSTGTIPLQTLSLKAGRDEK